MQAAQKTLEIAQLRYAAGYSAFLEVLDAVEQNPGLQLVSCRHESGAAFMAEAEGKLTGRPAVAMATRAVGAANLAIGLVLIRAGRRHVEDVLGGPRWRNATGSRSFGPWG